MNLKSCLIGPIGWGTCPPYPALANSHKGRYESYIGAGEGDATGIFCRSLNRPAASQVGVDFNSTRSYAYHGEVEVLGGGLSIVEFGHRLRQLRQGKGLTLRQLAVAVGVDFTYLSKIENDKAGYLPGAETIRSLAEVLGADALELLQLANKVPPEMESFAGDAKARRFLQRAQEVASPGDWDALLELLEERQRDRNRRRGQ